MLFEKLHQRAKQAGILVNGPHPWDPRIVPGKESAFARRVFFNGSLGLGEAYVDGWWRTEDLVGFFERIIQGWFESSRFLTIDRLTLRAQEILRNLQEGLRSFRVAETHYDLGNDLFEAMLDPTMMYTCAFRPDEQATLEEAQRYKVARSLDKLDLAPGQTLVDIGCGWGFLIGEAATRGIRAVGITISVEQKRYIEEKYAGLPITVHLCRYQDTPQTLDGKVDGIISIGMFEHTGPKNHRVFMETAKRLLVPNGRMMLHSIIGNDRADPFLGKYIFPNSALPSVTSIAKASFAAGLTLQHAENWGLDYAWTLREWRAKYLANRHRLDQEKYDERFDRMWTYYLSMCEAIFRTGNASLQQFVFSNGVLPGVYRAPPL